ncbi:apolipoprotein A-I-2-like isoform X2 [Hypomesus transpacificus]|uniref:apolipoprotein A-I-2-like isoform X2 n=1 Tax=Hypomesus transpacificus TaxID=137520 RepID=UPI001F078BCD|nr:apolipoprotein A-I-2-like isoform X2 [Hypomesus transpacificus]XP_046892468.1 apolipoprotein A-I-2-like isoform X2 [Hypomesus transpacificus]
MKFLALTLTILLATGIQARTLQADEAAPSQLEHVKVMKAGMTVVKDAMKMVLKPLDNTKYKEYHDKLSQLLDNMQEYYLTTYESYFKAFLGDQLLDATTTLSRQITTKVEELRKQLEPKQAELTAVLEKNMEDYRQKMEPLVQEYVLKQREEMDALRAKTEPILVSLREKTEPILDEMRAKVSSMAEDTKAVLVPMVESVRAKLDERIDELRRRAAPKTEEYKKNLSRFVKELKIFVDDCSEYFQGGQESIKEKLGHKERDEIAIELMALYESIKSFSTK